MDTGERQFGGILPFLVMDNSAHEAVGGHDIASGAGTNPEGCPCGCCGITHEQILAWDPFDLRPIMARCRARAFLRAIDPDRRGICALHGTDNQTNLWSKFTEIQVRNLNLDGGRFGGIGRWHALFPGARDEKGKYSAATCAKMVRARGFEAFFDDAEAAIRDEDGAIHQHTFRMPITRGVYRAVDCLTFLREAWRAIARVFDLCHEHYLEDDQLDELDRHVGYLRRGVRVIMDENVGLHPTPWTHVYCVHLPQQARRWRTMRWAITYLIDSAHKTVRRAVVNTFAGVQRGSRHPQGSGALVQALNMLVGDLQLQRLGFKVNGLHGLFEHPQELVQ